MTLSHARWLAVLLLAAASLRAAPAAAEEPAEAARVTELNEAGARFYREKNYHRAIEKFIEAYAIDHDPNLLFNVARCYEELGDTRAAIEKYTAYINAPGADAAGRVRADQSLRALRALQKQAAAPSRAPAAETAAATAEAAAPADRGGAAPASGGHRVLAWSALAAGALLAAGGGVAFTLGMRDHDRVTSAPGYGDPNAVSSLTLAEARDLAASGDQKKLAGGIALGIGGALVATSVVLFMLPNRTEGAASTGTFALGWAPGAGGLRASWMMRF